MTPTPPPARPVLEHVFATRPRCPRCASFHLRTYRTLPEESDGSLTRYSECQACRHRFKLVLEVSD